METKRHHHHHSKSNDMASEQETVWDIRDPTLPNVLKCDEFQLWLDGHCQRVYDANTLGCNRHKSGWAMRNTNNHDRSILKKSCVGILVCSKDCVYPDGKARYLRPGICDKARSMHIGSACPNKECTGTLIQRPCRGHGNFPVTHFWRTEGNRIYFQAKGVHDHPRPSLKPFRRKRDIRATNGNPTGHKTHSSEKQRKLAQSHQVPYPPAMMSQMAPYMNCNPTFPFSYMHAHLVTQQSGNPFCDDFAQQLLLNNSYLHGPSVPVPQQPKLSDDPSAAPAAFSGNFMPIVSQSSYTGATSTPQQHQPLVLPSTSSYSPLSWYAPPMTMAQALSHESKPSAQHPVPTMSKALDEETDEEESEEEDNHEVEPHAPFQLFGIPKPQQDTRPYLQTPTNEDSCWQQFLIKSYSSTNPTAINSFVQQPLQQQQVQQQNDSSLSSSGDSSLQRFSVDKRKSGDSTSLSLMASPPQQGMGSLGKRLPGDYWIRGSSPSLGSYPSLSSTLKFAPGSSSLSPGVVPPTSDVFTMKDDGLPSYHSAVGSEVFLSTSIAPLSMPIPQQQPFDSTIQWPGNALNSFGPPLAPHSSNPLLMKHSPNIHQHQSPPPTPSVCSFPYPGGPLQHQQLGQYPLGTVPNPMMPSYSPEMSAFHTLPASSPWTHMRA